VSDSFAEKGSLSTKLLFCLLRHCTLGSLFWLVVPTQLWLFPFQCKVGSWGCNFSISFS